MLTPRLLAAALLLAAPVAAATTPDAAAVAAHAEAELARHVADAGGPGMAVLVARGDEVLYRGARGMASIELGVPLRPDHVFRIGSVTKQFAAAGLLKLVDEGKVALDDPLSKFLPDYPRGDAYTVAQLLNHTSGIPSYTDIPGYMDQEIRRDLDTAALVAVFKDRPADFAPGAQWRYNNSGYVLVGAVIEAASGMPWDRWLATSQFEPLGLAATRGGHTQTVIPRHAAGYSASPEGVTTAAPLSMSQPHAAGALVSTVDDLHRWNRALHGGKVISPEGYRRMITPEGKAGEPPNRYGYGVQLGTLRGRALIEHGGGINGFLSMLLYLPDSEISVAVLRNSEGVGGEAATTLAKSLAAFALGDPYPAAVAVDVPEAELAALQGVYRQDAQNARTLRLVEGALTSQRSGGRPFRLLPIGDDSFLFEGSLTILRIERDADGKPVAMRFFAEGEGEGEVWPRTDESIDGPAAIELPRAALERLVGEYVADGLSFKVFFDDVDVLRVQVPGQPAFALKAIADDTLVVTEVDARFVFAPAEGPAQTATLLQGPARIEARRKVD